MQIPRLREWRELHGWTQKDLARESGVSLRSIAGYEAGAGARPNTARKLAESLDVGVADLVVMPGKAQAPPSPEQPSLNGLLEEERRVQYLRALRAIVHGLAGRWEKEPPKTSREIAPLYDALTAVVKEGVFEPSDVSSAEAVELRLLMIGFQRLNDIADKVEEVEKEEEAQQRRAEFALIQEQRSA